MMNSMYDQLCSFDNLERAYFKAKRHKSRRPDIIKFEAHRRLNLCILMKALRDKSYRQMPLNRFILRDPKTRTICVSDFRDRIVHHAIINILQPIFEPKFIFDSYASRKNKGNL